MELFKFILIAVYFFHFKKMKKIINNRSNWLWVALSEISYLLFVILFWNYRKYPPIFALWTIVILGIVSLISLKLKEKNYSYKDKQEYEFDRVLFKLGCIGTIIILLVLL